MRVVAAMAAVARDLLTLERTGHALAVIPRDAQLTDPPPTITSGPADQVGAPPRPLAERLLDLPPPTC